MTNVDHPQKTKEPSAEHFENKTQLKIGSYIFDSHKSIFRIIIFESTQYTKITKISETTHICDISLFQRGAERYLS